MRKMKAELEECITWFNRWLPPGSTDHGPISSLKADGPKTQAQEIYSPPQKQKTQVPSNQINKPTQPTILQNFQPISKLNPPHQQKNPTILKSKLIAQETNPYQNPQIYKASLSAQIKPQTQNQLPINRPNPNPTHEPNHPSATENPLTYPTKTQLPQPISQAISKPLSSNSIKLKIGGEKEAGMTVLDEKAEAESLQLVPHNEDANLLSEIQWKETRRLLQRFQEFSSLSSENISKIIEDDGKRGEASKLPLSCPQTGNDKNEGSTSFKEKYSPSYLIQQKKQLNIVWPAQGMLILGLWMCTPRVPKLHVSHGS